MQFINQQLKNNKEDLIKAIGEVRSSLGKDLNAAMQKKVEELAQIAVSTSDM